MFLTTIDDLTADILENIEGHVGLVEGQYVLELEDEDLEVGAVELVGQIPAERTELLALLDECVNEADAEEQPLPVLAVVVALERLLVDDAARTERLLQVVFETARWLDCHLDIFVCFVLHCL